MLQALDGAAAGRWLRRAADAVTDAAEEIDALNVYPVPDADTGTNLRLTLEGVRAALDGLEEGAAAGDVLAAAADGALREARGNSGTITAQMLAGWADALAGRDEASHRDVRRALRRADELAWAAVGAPVEGTVLSVSRAAARGASRGRGSLGRVVRAAGEAARVALEHTPDQLDLLARAGVVDAGGRGLVLVYDALVEVVTGEAPPPLPRAAPALLPSAQDCSTGGPGYEVVYLLSVAGVDDGEAGGERRRRRGGPRDADAAVAALRSTLAGLGDSLVVVGGGGLWNVHVHVDDPGAAVEAGMEAGRPHGIRITSLHRAVPVAPAPAAPSAQPPPSDGEAPSDGGAPADGEAPSGEEAQPAESALSVPPASLPASPAPPPPSAEATPSATSPAPPAALAGTDEVALVAWAAGPGLADAFAETGAVVVPTGSSAPGTDDVLDVVRRTGAPSVVLLPNERATLAVAEEAAVRARAEGLRVVVVPTRTQVQGLAAAAVHTLGRTLEEDLVAMSAAAGGCRHGAVTVALHDGITSAGACRAGDVLGVVDGDFAVVGATLAEVAREVADRLLGGGGDLLTLVVGAQAPTGLAEAVGESARRVRAGLEVQVIDGGQARYPLLLGVE